MDDRWFGLGDRGRYPPCRMNENPYRPPDSNTYETPQQAVEVLRSAGGNLRFQLVDVQKTWFTRKAKFDGDFSGTISYDCRGLNSESVFIDSERIVIPAESQFTLDLVKPMIEFELECDSEKIPVQMEVKCSNLFFYITRFKLTVGGKLLYNET